MNYYVNPVLVNYPLIVLMPQEPGGPNQDAEDKNTELPPGPYPPLWPDPKGPKKRYKYCIVPECKSTTTRTPDKLFFSIPTGETRGRWCEAAGRVPPKYKPLSLMCNRFCCEDHFDLEKDMENYLQWKLMGRKGTKKLILKQGVLPHKFACRDEPTPAVKEKRRKKLIEEILEEDRQKELKEISDQRKKEEKEKNKWKLPELRPKEMPKEIPKYEMITEYTISEKKKKKKIISKISRQRKKKEKEKKEWKLLELRPKEMPKEIPKYERISEYTISEKREKKKIISRPTQVNSKHQEMETYTFYIKCETENDLEPNDGCGPKDIVFQDANTAVQDNSHSLEINVKVEEMDEEFERELVDVEMKENIIKDETNNTVTTEVNPVLTENNTLVINKTDNLINDAISNISNGDKGDDDCDPIIIKEEIQEIIEDRTNPVSIKTNDFLITENVRDKKVFERVIMGKRTQEIIEE
ncbi:DNA ligase 1-like isoform X2 [Maniola jurtina]|uniref:DNA ligase 1-like isoform X2 n=1 Tax=Maniola jurtina TaxID=191418 RepID=UPI001E68D7DC|nr:DNA ligase 1-like isoform X2 [Maniola jurtina]